MSQFRIAVAQIPSVRGDLSGNIAKHLEAISTAAVHKISVLVFPELSLIGYEPDLASEFQLHASDTRLAPIARMASRHHMQAVVGAPIASAQRKPYLGALVFGADATVRTYAKMHLGGTEQDFFLAGDTELTIESHGEIIGLSICADSSRPSHPAAYAARGATVYASSVFLNESWYATDSPRLAKYASEFGMLVLMANHSASVGTLASVGKSAAWAPDGSLLATAKDTDSSLVVATRSNGSWEGEVIHIR